MKQVELRSPNSTPCLNHSTATAAARRQRARRCRAPSIMGVAVLMVVVVGLVLPADSQSASEVDATRETSHHHKRDHRHSDLQDLPQTRIEPNVRPISSQTLQWRTERKKPYSGPYLSSKWNDPVRASHNSFPKGVKTGPERVSSVQKEDLSERQKRTEAEKSSSSSWQGSNHLRLKDGGYEGLVVEVSRGVEQTDCKPIIDGIQVSTPHFSFVVTIFEYRKKTTDIW